MSMNYIKQFMEDNGIEVGERFALAADGNSTENMYFFDKGCMLMSCCCDGISAQTASPTTLTEMLSGEVEVLKKPFRPKMCERYYYIDNDRFVSDDVNGLTCVDLALISMGNCFRTEKEAIAHKDEILKKFDELKKECE